MSRFNSRSVQANLFNAITVGNFDAMKNAVQNGVNINEPDFCGRIALGHAASFGVERMRQVLSLGAEQEFVDDECNTALIIAARYHRSEEVIFLLSVGVDSGAEGKESFAEMLFRFDDAFIAQAQAAIERHRLNLVINEDVEQHNYFSF